MAAPNHADQPPPAPASAPASSPPTAGHDHDPAAAAPDQDPTQLLAKLVGDGEPTTTPRRPVSPPLPSNRAAMRALIRERALHAAGHYSGGATERAARRLFEVPMDYLRAGQESRERRRRRKIVRRNVRVLLSIHEDRASERSLSAMMARLATTMEPAAPAAGDGGVADASKDAAAAAAASTKEHDELGEMLDKMELSFKD